MKSACTIGRTSWKFLPGIQQSTGRLPSFPIIIYQSICIMADSSEQKCLSREMLGMNRQVAPTGKYKGGSSVENVSFRFPRKRKRASVDCTTFTDINPEMRSEASVLYGMDSSVPRAVYYVCKGASASGCSSNKRRNAYSVDEMSASIARLSLHPDQAEAGGEGKLEQAQIDVCHEVVQITPVNISMKSVIPKDNMKNMCSMNAGSGVNLLQNSLSGSYFKTGTYLVENLNVLLNRLMEVKAAAFFFIPDFMLNTPDFMDVRATIEKCKTRGYGNIFEVVHELKGIIYQARMCLENKPHRYSKLRNAIVGLQADIERMLAEDFEDINGRRNENLHDIIE